MLHYIENTKTCRNIQLVSYFGETTAEKCGICSVCKPQVAQLSKRELQQIAEHILALLEAEDLSSREILERLTFAETDALKVIKLLMDSEKININPRNQYYLK